MDQAQKNIKFYSLIKDEYQVQLRTVHFLENAQYILIYPILLKLIHFKLNKEYHIMLNDLMNIPNIMIDGNFLMRILYHDYYLSIHHTLDGLTYMEVFLNYIYYNIYVY